MSKKKELIICFGSSCFARGSKQLVQIIKQYLEEHQLHHKVNFKGKHCFGDCENGPSIKIDGKKFDHIKPENVQEILDKELL